jgi:hypothetical protein
MNFLEKTTIDQSFLCMSLISIHVFCTCAHYTAFRVLRVDIMFPITKFHYIYIYIYISFVHSYIHITQLLQNLPSLFTFKFA